MLALYACGVALYHAAVRVAAWRSPKAKAWLSGRKGLEARLRAKTDDLRGCVWMHCASVGEFEQGRPVLEALRAEQPEVPILLTFFSPSGFEAQKHYPLATHVDYLPADSAQNARWFLDLTAPSKAIFVKYEFWYHHLAAVHERGIPSYLIAGLFRPDQPFFRWYGSAWRRMLRSFTAIGTQDEASAELLRGLGPGMVEVCGDPRFDRVLAIRAHPPLPLAAAYRAQAVSVVLGSTWPADEAAVVPELLKHRSVKVLIAPHELTPEHLAAVEGAFPKPLVRWSELEAAGPTNTAATLGNTEGGTLLVDRMGLLARLYAYGDIAYVGGGFGDGIHNLLEAAVHGIPVIFGPRHHKFPEAKGLAEAGGGFATATPEALRQVLAQLIADPQQRIEAGRKAAAYVQERAGATVRTLALLQRPHTA